MSKVAITGIGIVSALGESAERAVAGCRAGRRAFAPVRAFDAASFKVNLAAEVPELDTAGRFGSRAMRRTSRTDRLALWAASDALAQANLGDRTTCGVFVGASSGGMAEMERAKLRGGRIPFSTYWSYPVGATARTLAQLCDLGGPAVSTMTACSSAAHALGMAMHRIRRGQLDVALAGGAEGMSRLTLAGFGSLGVLDPAGTRPFSADRKGITLGEGAAFFVLEPLERARKRGARVLAVLGGYGSSADAHHMVHPKDDGAGALAAMRAALRDAGVDPSEVDYVNAHGTGTVQNDAMESRALAQLFGSRSVAVSSSKSMLGHTLGAAGALEAALTALGIVHGFLPPSAGVVERMPELGGLDLVTSARDAKLRVALSSSFAFGGNNAALVLTSEDAAKEPAKPAKRPVVITGAAVACPRGTATTAAAMVQLEGAPPPQTREATGLDPSAVVDKGALRRMDPLSAGACGVMALALKSAGRATPDPALGIGFGTGFASLDATTKFLARLFEKGATLVNPLEFPNLVHNAPAGYASIALGAAGANITTTQEELAGDHAVATMAGRVAYGSLDAALASGGDLASASLDTAYRTIDLGEASAPSTVLSALVLESLEAAKARGAAPWARLVATAGGGRHGGVRAAVESVLRDSGPVDLWLAGAVNARETSFEQVSHDKLARAERLEARRVLGDACAAGAAVIALAAARIATGRAKTVLVTSVTRDGQAQATLLTTV